MPISPWKRGLEVQTFLTFPVSLWTFRKSKRKYFLGFYSVFRWSSYSSYIQKPCTIRVKLCKEDIVLCGINLVNLKPWINEQLIFFCFPGFTFFANYYAWWPSELIDITMPLILPTSRCYSLDFQRWNGHFHNSTKNWNNSFCLIE